MNLIELRKLVSDKLNVAPRLVMNHNDQSVKVKIDGREFLISTSLCVCSDLNRMFNPYDSDARQLEKLLRGEQWDGTGLPPVGTECEYEESNGRWVHVEIMYLSKWVIVMRSKENNIGNGVDIAKDIVMDKLCRFRPLRTERDKAVEQMIDFHRNTLGSHNDSMRQLYDAIVAGKIDGLGKVG